MKHSHSHSPILKKFLIAFAVLGTLIAFAAMLIMTTQQSTAQVQTGDLSGYAYSNVEGVGWISMSCENDGSCGSVNYGVNIDNSGNWSGRGWSPNVGWINFGGSAEVPAQCGPRPSTTTSGVTTGWAYLASSSGASLQDSGAITGCISMSGTALDGTPYGVEVDYATDTLGGYAWSGYDVQTDTTGDGSNDWQSNGIANVGLGWINFSNVSITTDPDQLSLFVSYQSSVCEGDAIDPVTINYGNAITCTTSGPVWQSSGDVFTATDPTNVEFGSVTSSVQEYISQGSLSGQVICTGIPNTETISADVSINYYSENSAECRIDPPCEPGEPCWCVENPTDPICEICVTDPSDPSCPIGPLCTWYPTHPLCQECIQDPTLPQCAPPGPVSPIWFEQ